MSMLPTALTTIAFGTAAAAYAMAAVIAVSSRLSTPQARSFALALCVTAVWAAIYAWAAPEAGATAAPWLPLADALHAAAVVVFLAAILAESTAGRRNGRVAGIIALPIVLVSVVAVAAAAVQWPPLQTLLGPGATPVALIALALAGALLLQQIIANAEGELRRGLRPLTLAVCIILGVDLIAFSYTAFTGALHPNLTLIRGLGNAFAAPLLVLAARMRPDWSTEVYVSRQIVFYTTGLLGVGLFLLALAVAAAFVVSGESRWNSLPVVVVVLGTVLALSVVLLSATFRRRVRVFISKNFYRDRYDYRKEWLRLIETLVGRSDDLPLRTRAVKALAEIIDSAQGELWLRDKESARFEGHGGWGTEPPGDVIEPDDPLAAYLERSNWVVDTLEYRSNPALYSNAFGADAEFLRDDAIFVPILNRDALIGIVRLQRPPGLGDLSFEDHDLLKTAGQQVAVFLVHERAQEELFETRQFEAFSKLTAFLMHDLKNMIAQQDLVVANARRFKHRPEFIDDAIATIASSVERMRKILDRLQGSTRMEKSSRIDLVELVHDVCTNCSDRRPAPRIVVPGDRLLVEMDRDRLAMAITHLIRNAQDATPENGTVDVELSAGVGHAVIEVSDSGCGMDAEFVRTRLFRPFDSTKGAQGMGIGAYQIRETLRSVGGTIDVESAPGSGTTMRVRLQLASVAHPQEAEVVA